MPMSSKQLAGIPVHLAQRILSFFNSAQQVSSITNSIIQDDPSDGPGNTIGPTLAARILRARKVLPRNRFTNLEELDAIPGFGTGTWDDLIYTFGPTAGETFRRKMYEEHVIFESNWPLWLFEYPIEDPKEFQELATDDLKFRAFIGQQLEQICATEGAQKEHCAQALEAVSTNYLDAFTNSTQEAAHAMALWFYRFDADNWFSYEQVFEQTQAYFSFYPDYPWEMDLRFFKGIESTLIEPGITVSDLPIVINYPEQSISVWMSTLYD